MAVCERETFWGGKEPFRHIILKGDCRVGEWVAPPNPQNPSVQKRNGAGDGGKGLEIEKRSLREEGRSEGTIFRLGRSRGEPQKKVIEWQAGSCLSLAPESVFQRVLCKGGLLRSERRQRSTGREVYS